MMVQKNIEMQLQAIRIIKERNGVLPECLTEGSDVFSEIEQEEMKILREVLRKSKEEYELEQERKRTEEARAKLRAPDVTHNFPGDSREAVKVKESTEGAEDSEETPKCPLEGSHQSTKEDPKPVCPVQKGTENLPQPSCTKGKEDTKKRSAGKGSENTVQKAGVKGPDLSETEKQQLKQREDYLKKKRDLLLATKKESKNNAPPPPAAASTDQKEEESPPKEVKHFHMNPQVLSVQVPMLLLKSGNGLKRTRGEIFPSYWFCRGFGLEGSVMKLALVGFGIIKPS
uniref:Cilia and flagella associated protein 36 n=1 Tax=Cyanistes caeruleus TaxID=156563 RepID=A0A8C0ZCS6_CYACU